MSFCSSRSHARIATNLTQQETTSETSKIIQIPDTKKNHSGPFYRKYESSRRGEKKLGQFYLCAKESLPSFWKNIQRFQTQTEFIVHLFKENMKNS